MIVECLFVDAHEDNRRIRWFDVPPSHIHKHITTQIDQRIVPDPTGICLILNCLYLSWWAVTCSRYSGCGYFHQGVGDNSYLVEWVTVDPAKLLESYSFS